MTLHGTSHFGHGGYICSVQSYLTVIFQVSDDAGIASEITHVYKQIALRTQDLWNTAVLEFLSLYGHALIVSHVWYSLLPTEFSYSRLLYFCSCTHLYYSPRFRSGMQIHCFANLQDLTWNTLQCDKSSNQTKLHIMKSRRQYFNIQESTHYNPNNRFIDCITLLSSFPQTTLYSSISVNHLLMYMLLCWFCLMSVS